MEIWMWPLSPPWAQGAGPSGLCLLICFQGRRKEVPVTLNPASALSLCWAPSWEEAEASGQLRGSALVADCLLKSINELPLAPPCLDQRGFSTSLCCPVGRSWSLSQTNPSLPFPWESSPGQGPSGSDSWPAGPRLWGPLATSVPHPS